MDLSESLNKAVSSEGVILLNDLVDKINRIKLTLEDDIYTVTVSRINSGTDINWGIYATVEVNINKKPDKDTQK